MRSQNQLTQPLVGEEDFHRWLSMTRLLARSYSNSDVTLKDWESSLSLDDLIRLHRNVRTEQGTYQRVL